MTHSYTWHDSWIYETWLMNIWDMTHEYMRHNSSIWHLAQSKQEAAQAWHMLQCVAVWVCCSVLQSVAECCSVLQCVAVCIAVRYSVLQCVAVCCSALQCVAVRCNALQCVLQSVAECEMTTSYNTRLIQPDTLQTVEMRQHTHSYSHIYTSTHLPMYLARRRSDWK